MYFTLGALVLSSGYGPEANCITNDASSYTYILGTPGDADLSLLTSGADTYDATVLQFDVTAKFNGQLSFTYVFGSEEYNEYVASPFNDVFAFYIDGTNVATVGPVPVSIHDVNLGQNSDIYVNNDGLMLGYPTPYATQYDGFTKVLTTTPYTVQAGRTYHMKLAIADTADRVYDSVVYIKAKSVVVCPAGTANCRGGCNACCARAGSFCPTADPSGTQKCTPGYYCPTDGLRAAGRKPCPCGAFCPEGASAPSQCPAGSLCPAASGAPALCPAGKYCTAGACKPSDPACGYYAPPGTSMPPPCPAGAYCPAGTSAPIPCPPGSQCRVGAAPAGGRRWAPAGLCGPFPCSARYYCPNTTALVGCPCGA